MIDALWIGPYGYRAPDGTVLVTGETVYSIPDGEAEASDNWKPFADRAVPAVAAANVVPKEGDS